MQTLKTFEAFRVDETEGLIVKKIGLRDKDGAKELAITINGHEYGYKEKEDGDKKITDVATTFEKMLKYSAGRALQWLKRNTVLSSGSKKNESEIFEKFGLLIVESELVSFEAFVQQIK
jgi:hypothetical protein